MVIAADLFAFGINYNPTCERSKVYPETHLTGALRQIAGDRFIAPINPAWSLRALLDAVLPPNAAMVYGLHDVQGYDSLYTREYKDLASRIQGEDSSPQENGNMVLIRRYTPDLGRLADFAVSSMPLDATRAMRSWYNQSMGSMSIDSGPMNPSRKMSRAVSRSLSGSACILRCWESPGLHLPDSLRSLGANGMNKPDETAIPYK